MGLNPSQISFLVLTPIIEYCNRPRNESPAFITTVQPFTCQLFHSNIRHGSMLFTDSYLFTSTCELFREEEG